MLFYSTRDPVARYSAAQAVACGLSPEGGRFFPETLPVFSFDRILAMAAMRGPRVMQTVLAELLPGFAESALREAVAAAWETAGDPPPRPVRPGIWSAELFFGPTGTLHDLPMQILVRLLPHAAKAAGLSETPAALCASVDAGRAALAAFAEEGGSVLAFFAEEETPSLTRRQAEALQDEGRRALTVQAGWDELRARVEKQCVRQTSPERPLVWAGPDNWAWLAAQAARYFVLYAGLVRAEALEGGEPVNLVLPCGGGHQLLAALTAKACGLPVGRILCACQADSALPHFVQTGGWAPRARESACDPSLSPRIAPGLEQLLFFLTRDAASTAEKAALLKQTGTLPSDPAWARAMEEAGVRAFLIDGQRRERAMEDLWQGRGVLTAPHTGLAAAALRQYAALTGDKTPALWMATASPFLFPEEVLPAMGLDFDGNDRQRLEAMEIVGGQSAPAFLKALPDGGEDSGSAVPPEALYKIISELS